MRVTLRFRQPTLSRPMPEQMDLSTGRTFKFNVRGSFAFYAYQGPSLTEAEMDEVDSKLPPDIRFARPPRNEDLTLTTGKTVRVEIYLNEARQHQGINPHLTSEEDQELRRVLRRRGISPRWWSEGPDEA